MTVERRLVSKAVLPMAAAFSPNQSLLVAKIGRDLPTFASEFSDEDFLLLLQNSGVARHCP